jgi:hypothetical protein
MKTAHALAAARPAPAWGSATGVPEVQVPLPFPGIAPVLPVPVERDDIGPLRHRCARFMQALVEVLSGERPVRQMAAWMAPEVYTELQRRLHAGARPSSPGRRTRSSARLVSVHVSMVDEQIAEVAGRMVHRQRSRAMAVRLEPQLTHRGELVWRCTALEWA